MAKKITKIHEDENGRNVGFIVDGQQRTLNEVIKDINRGTEYRTAPPRGGGVPIHVVKDKDGEYIRTDPNGKEGDNLDNLPKF